MPVRYSRHVLAEPRTRLPLFTRKALHKARLPVDPPPAELRLPARLQRLHDVGARAFEHYRPEPYDGAATLFLAGRRYPAFCDPSAAWPRYVRGGLSIERVFADHETVVSEEAVGPLAAAMSRLLATPAVRGI
jgi:thioesterase domain-containing protein